jgi:hypothetical protein
MNLQKVHLIDATMCTHLHVYVQIMGHYISNSHQIPDWVTTMMHMVVVVIPVMESWCVVNTLRSMCMVQCNSRAKV